LLGEEIKELREGIDTFQKESFKAIYDGKQVKWDPAASSSSEPQLDKPVVPVAVDTAVAVSETTPEIPPAEAAPPAVAVAVTPVPEVTAPVAEALVDKVAEPVAPAAVKSKAVPAASTPIEVFTSTESAVIPAKTLSPEALALKDVPIDQSAPKKESVSTVDVLKAQQAVAKSFLFLGKQQESVEVEQPAVEPPKPAASVTAVKAETKPLPAAPTPSTTAAVAAKVVLPSPKPAPVTAPKPADSMLEGVFGFLKSDPNVMVAARTRTNSPPAVAQAFLQRPSNKAVVADEEEESAEAKKLRLKSPVVTIAEARKEAAKPAAAATAASTAATTAPVAAAAPPKETKETSGGLFGLFKQPAASAPVPVKPAVVVAPVKPAVVEVPAAAAPAPAAPTPAGGLFSFLSPSPAPPKVAAPVPVKVPVSVPKKEIAVPVVAVTAPAKPSPTIPASSGLFSFLNPTPAAPAPVIPKAAAPLPAPVPPAPAAGGFLSFLQPSVPKPAPPATPAVVPATKTVAKTAVPPAKPPAVISTPPKLVTPAAKVPAPAVPAKVEPAAEVKAASGGLFGFLGSKPETKAAPVSEPAVKPAVATKAAASTKTTASVTAAATSPAKAKAAETPVKAEPVKPAPSGGLFGFLNAKPDAPKAVAPAPAVVASVPIATKAKAAASPAVKDKAVEVPVVQSPAKPAPSGGLFGFLNAKPDAPKAAAPAPAVVASVPVSTKAKAAASPAVKDKAIEAPVAQSPAKPAPSGGLFGFLTPSPPVATASSTAAAASKPPAKAAVSMNPKFTAQVSLLLKKDAAKISQLQTATDNYRSGNSDASGFLSSLEKLFGGDLALLEAVVPPLIAELPEKNLASQLQTAFDRFQVANKKKTAAAVKSTPAVAAAAGAVIKAPEKVPILKKSLVEAQLKALAGGSSSATEVSSVLVRELGKTKLRDIAADLQAQLPKDKADALAAAFKAASV